MSFGTFAESQTKIRFEPEEALPEIVGGDDFAMKKNLRTGERKWVVPEPKARIGIYADAYGLGYGKGTLTDIIILGQKIPSYQDEVDDEVGTKWVKKGKGKWTKHTGSVDTVIKRNLKDVPKRKRKDSYHWEAEGYITLTPYAWKTKYKTSSALSWPFAVTGTTGRTGEWVDWTSKSFSRWAVSGREGDHELEVTEYDPLSVSFFKTTATGHYSYGPTSFFMSDEGVKVRITMEGLTSASVKLDGQSPIVDSTIDKHPDTIWISSDFSGLDFSSSKEWKGKITVTVTYKDSNGKKYSTDVEKDITVTYRDPLSVSFNKTDFTSDEKLEVTIERAGLTSAYIELNGLHKEAPRTDASGNITISCGFSGLDFSSSNEWYDYVTVYVNYKANGNLEQDKVEQYITVKKLGYFAKSTSLSAYGTYEAEVVYDKPIQEVRWEIKKPGGKGYKTVKDDKVNGGKTSSLSLSLDSTTGTYSVFVWVYYRSDGMDNMDIHTSSFTVGN